MSRLQNIKKLYSKPLFVNIASLGILQVANYIIPILIIPFVTKALGADFFGKASYAQNIISYLTIIVSYGFEYSATQDVAIHRDDKSKLQTIFWTVIRFKSFLLVISFVLLAILYFTFSKVNQDPFLYFYAALINVGLVLFPTWFFQGIEKMKDMAMFNFAIKLLGAVLVILLVNVSADYVTYVLILSLSYVLVGIISFLYVIKKYDLVLSYRKNKELSNNVIKKGAPIFLNNVFISLYAAVGMTIVGIYMTDFDVGIYSGAYKIIFAVIMLTCMPISFALFPVMSRKFNQSKKEGWQFFKRSLLLIFVLSLLISIIVYLLSPYIVKIFLGNEFYDAIAILRKMSMIPSLVIIATMLTVQGLYGLQLQRYSPMVGLSCGGASLICSIILIPKIGIDGAILSWILAQIIEISIVSFLIYKHIKN